MRLSKILTLPFIVLSAYTLHGRYNNKPSTTLTEPRFAKFFRTEKSDPPHLPPLPELNRFDRGILKVCGDWGSPPTRKAFKKFLNRHPEVLEKIYNELNRQIITRNADLETFKEEFIDIWFRNRGFVHIFCGEPDGHLQWTGLGGMHFIGRYVEAQEKGWAGAIWDDKICDKNEIRHPVYTIGILYKNTEGEIKKKCPGGFDYSDAETIFIEATKAFKDFQGVELNKEVELKKAGTCIHDSTNGYPFVLQMDEYSILSFFSSLSGKGNKCHLSSFLRQVEAKVKENKSTRQV
ncbi:EndoU domain-containing protein [Wolbachia endosymbiont of Cantharis cryptica]|uniref:EndoU domain-containing protein n=1 Tax=Wolbachia endosymbiont of Cantharis cryptica TaxID=3066132 RepID=UPI00376F1EB1